MAKARRSYHHGDLRQALIGASIEILAEEGLLALTLRSAARKVGVSHAAPKNHFGDLRGLLTAVAAEGFRRMHEALEMARARARRRGPAAALLAIGPAYVAFAMAAPGHFRAMFHPALGEHHQSDELASASSATFAVLVSSMAAAQRAGVVGGDDPVAASISAWSIVHGLASLAVDGHLARKGLSVDHGQLARTVTRHLFEGLGAVAVGEGGAHST
ncbi:MAG: WHG domain-containing protein [Polyangiaceae bacterium]